MNPDMVTWEAVYNDGDTLRMVDGALYRDIDRTRLSSFRLWVYYNLVAELYVEPDTILTYRRRTSITNESRTVQFIIGNYPDGGVVVFDALREETFRSRFGEPHPVADFSPPVLIPEEGEL
jgi:hypothetical protein